MYDALEIMAYEPIYSSSFCTILNILPVFPCKKFQIFCLNFRVSRGKAPRKHPQDLQCDGVRYHICQYGQLEYASERTRENIDMKDVIVEDRRVEDRRQIIKGQQGLGRECRSKGNATCVGKHCFEC